MTVSLVVLWWDWMLLLFGKFKFLIKSGNYVFMRIVSSVKRNVEGRIFFSFIYYCEEGECVYVTERNINRKI